MITRFKIFENINNNKSLKFNIIKTIRDWYDNNQSIFEDKEKEGEYNDIEIDFDDYTITIKYQIRFENDYTSPGDDLTPPYRNYDLEVDIIDYDIYNNETDEDIEIDLTEEIKDILIENLSLDELIKKYFLIMITKFKLFENNSEDDVIGQVYLSDMNNKWVIIDENPVQNDPRYKYIFYNLDNSRISYDNLLDSDNYICEIDEYLKMYPESLDKIMDKINKNDNKRKYFNKIINKSYILRKAMVRRKFGI